MKTTLAAAIATLLLAGCGGTDPLVATFPAPDHTSPASWRCVSAPAPAPDWQDSADYAAGDQVIFQGHLWQKAAEGWTDLGTACH